MTNVENTSYGNEIFDGVASSRFERRRGKRFHDPAKVFGQFNDVFARKTAMNYEGMRSSDQLIFFCFFDLFVSLDTSTLRFNTFRVSYITSIRKNDRSTAETLRNYCVQFEFVLFRILTFFDRPIFFNFLLLNFSLFVCLRTQLSKSTCTCLRDCLQLGKRRERFDRRAHARHHQRQRSFYRLSISLDRLYDRNCKGTSVSMTERINIQI